MLRGESLSRSTFLMFSWMQVFTASGFAFSHGSNDIANAIGPFAAILDVLRTGSIEGKAAVPAAAMLTFGVALCAGLWFIGRRVIATVGHNLTTMHPASGFSAELSAAAVVMGATVLGLPVSHTHILIGAVLGIGTANRATNCGLMKPIALAWVIKCRRRRSSPRSVLSRYARSSDQEPVLFVYGPLVRGRQVRGGVQENSSHGAGTKPPMTHDLIDTAQDLVERILGQHPERLHHSAAVAASARALAITVERSAVETLVAAAWLHDIGYGSPLQETGFHPLDGAYYLRSEGWPEPVCALVAHHSGSRFVARVLGLDDQLRAFEFVEEPRSDALTVADNTVGPNGTIMTVDERLREKLKRHGADSPNMRANLERDEYIRAAAWRVARRMAVLDQFDSEPGNLQR